MSYFEHYHHFKQAPLLYALDDTTDFQDVYKKSQVEASSRTFLAWGQEVKMSCLCQRYSWCHARGQELSFKEDSDRHWNILRSLRWEY